MAQKNRQLALIALVMIPVIIVLWLFLREAESNRESIPLETSTIQPDAIEVAEPPVPIEDIQERTIADNGAAEQRAATLGAFDLLDLDGQPLRPTLTIVDQSGNRESELFFHDFSRELERYEVFPGIYTIQIEEAGAFRNVIITEDETALLQFGAFDLRGPTDESVRTLLRIFEQRQSGLIGPLVTTFEEGHDHFKIVPCIYTIQVDGAGTFHDITIRSGEVTPLSLGAFDLRNADSSISRPNLTIIDQESGEQINKLFADFTTNLPRYYLVPGLYQLEIEEGILIESVEIQAGEETIVSLP